MAFPVCDSLPVVVAEVVGLSLPNAHKPRLKPKSKEKHKCKLSLPWLWNTKASVGSTRWEPSVRNQQQRWWGKARKFLDNCFHGTTDSKRERAQDGSFAVVSKREERAYEIENRKRLRKRQGKRVWEKLRMSNGPKRRLGTNCIQWPNLVTFEKFWTLFILAQILLWFIGI